MKTKDKSYFQEGIEIRRNKNKITRTPLRLASDERHSEHEVWLRPRQYLPAVSSTVDDLPGYFAIPPPETFDFEAPLRHSFIKVWLTMFAIERTREIIQKLRGRGGTSTVF